MAAREKTHEDGNEQGRHSESKRRAAFTAIRAKFICDSVDGQPQSCQGEERRDRQEHNEFGEAGRAICAGLGETEPHRPAPFDCECNHIRPQRIDHQYGGDPVDPPGDGRNEEGGDCEGHQA